MTSASTEKAGGPLKGLRIVELLGLGPGPYASMLLSDMGADVVTIARPGQWKSDARYFVNRGRTAVELDLKKSGDVEAAKELANSGHVLIEGFRPGVMERLGLGPDDLHANNPRLIYARMTGWGQNGRLAHTAGHDINYIAVTGALDSFRSLEGKPTAPLNLVGDYGGGALFLVVGVLAALYETRASGKGQVIDIAMCDGVVSMTSLFHSLKALGSWNDTPSTNFLDGGAHYYQTYACKDGRFLAVGAIEPQFYKTLLSLLGETSDNLSNQLEASGWTRCRQTLSKIFLTKSLTEWMSIFEGSDACVSPVISMADAPGYGHLNDRGTFIEFDGYCQPAPAPRFSRTASKIQNSAAIQPIPIANAIERWKRTPIQ